MCTLPPLGAPQFGEGGASTAFTHPPKPPVYPPPAPQTPMYPFFRTPSPSPTSIAMRLKASAHFVHFMKKAPHSCLYDWRQRNGTDFKRQVCRFFSFPHLQVLRMFVGFPSHIQLLKLEKFRAGENKPVLRMRLARIRDPKLCKFHPKLCGNLASALLHTRRGQHCKTRRFH